MTVIDMVAKATATPRRSLASFFIKRPIFAIVLAIVTSLAGLVGIFTLPISQYPEIAPTTIQISASYTGANAEAVENAVTTVIENGMTGLSNLLYMESTSSSASSSISLTFGSGVDPDIAQVQVQNKLALVENQLPDTVRTAGISVSRSVSSILMVGTIVSNDDKYSTAELGNIMTTTIEPQIKRLQGVGSVRLFGSGYAMRIWLDPLALAKYSLTTADVTSAIQKQNVQVSAGSIGSSPTVAGQQLRATITAQTTLKTVAQFENIILASATDGSAVRLRDVARVELGLESYGASSRYNGHASAGFGVLLASGANAINTANAVHAEIDELRGSLPEGVEIAYPYETTPFVVLSIEKVVETLIEAIVLVFVVLLVFLQNWRATLIPMIAVPVVMLGTFGVLAVLGYSINTLTMFAMVLAIGLLVDDAIVVVENVERIMAEEHLSPREATEKSMGEITGALIGIVAVLCAVFLPMAFFSGSVGVIYRQFSITIASAMVLSVLVAITLTPALCAIMLKPHATTRRFNLFGWFNTGFNAATSGYVKTVGFLVVRPLRMIVVFLALVGGAYWFYMQLPTSFIPEEDQGVLITSIQLPNGASAERTTAVLKQVENYFLTSEKDDVEAVFSALGFSFSGSGDNYALAFVRLKDFDLRKSKQQAASAIAMRALMSLGQIRDAQIFTLAPPTIQGLGQSGGFDMVMLDTGNKGSEALNAASNTLAQEAQTTKEVANVRGNAGQLDSQLKVAIDLEKAGALGVDIQAANAILQVAFAGYHVNDFIRDGDIKPVIVQSDAPYRMQPDDIKQWYAKNASGELVPFSSFTTLQWQQNPASLARFNGVRSITISGTGAAGVSSGTAMDKMEAMVKAIPGGYTAGWTGLSYQERLSGSQALLLYGVCILVVFLCLAALYESWTIPFSVILAVPVGLFGALAAASLFGQSNDVYFKVGMLTTMGLSAKNAILIVEFARDQIAGGKTALDAILTAARQRLRPIAMTSIAFLLGVLPLALATGAGSGAQNAIGVGVVGGTLTGTLLGIFFVPLFFFLISGGWRRSTRRAPATP
jgi:multidrug efflux pump